MGEILVACSSETVDYWATVHGCRLLVVQTS